MKTTKILLATVAVLATSSAQAEVIYAKPNSIIEWHSPRPFKTIIGGGPATDDDAKNPLPVVADPAGSQTRLFLITRQPYGQAMVGAAEFVVLDANGDIIDKLTVMITPTGTELRPLQIITNGNHITYLWCGSLPVGCLPAMRAKDPKAEEQTRHRDGSTTYRQEY